MKLLALLLPLALASDAPSDEPSAPILPSTDQFYICSSSNEDLLGTYVGSGFEDETTMWKNEDGMGIWRHGGFWYVGDYAAWPPQTFYRCVVGCEQHLESPPLSGYKTKKGVDEVADLAIQSTPCAAPDL